ncbi:hypothetical protein R6V09_07025 [Streptomyces sp. W16]|uniref:hypothetical protein n=1 Tax=Streptomyces sp. W16 TaxID=3076631 RepID=UPI00295A7D1E|nr:hypothetical protein [Streptomyces sp. W16]MDV9169890.1 hypothetical protein [Streptomyces sp. W16]
MTENQSGEVGPVEPVEPVEPTALTSTPSPESEVEAAVEAAVEADAPKRRVRRGRIAAVVGCALLAVAVVGGVGYTVVTVNGADRDAGAPVWRFPESVAEQRAASAKGLAAMLRPYDYDYVRGPDIAEFGADAQLTGREATALRKQEISGLPRSQRLLLEKQIDREQLKGIAMRSYVRNPADVADVYSVEVQLAQMDEKAARNLVTYENELLNTVDAFRKGPTVPGHKEARCFLPKQVSGEKLDEMLCFADVGDVLITLDASGTKSMDTKGIATFLREQLERIKTTGEAV